MQASCECFFTTRVRAAAPFTCHKATEKPTMACMNRVAIIVLLLSVAVFPLAAQELLPRWEAIDMAKGVDLHANEMKVLIEQVRPKEWIQDGAPQAYVTQHEELLRDMDSLSLSAQDMIRNPEGLISVVDTFLWIDRLGSMISSLEQGVRKYQNAAVAELLVAAKDRNTSESEKLKGYLRQLAVAHEAELEIADSEAQRCRAELARQPPKR